MLESEDITVYGSITNNHTLKDKRFRTRNMSNARTMEQSSLNNLDHPLVKQRIAVTPHGSALGIHNNVLIEEHSSTLQEKRSLSTMGVRTNMDYPQTK